MPLDPRFIASFQEDKFYHVTSKTVGKRPLFLNDENKRYFLKRYKDFLFSFVDTYSYNLLKNHVHFVIKIKPESVITGFLKLHDIENLTHTHKKFLAGECDLHELIEQQFHRLFISYSLSFNKQQNLDGHLFNRPFKRTEITDDTHFTQACVYVHANNLHHGFKNDFTKYKWSSYQSILSNRPTDIMREAMLEWFGGRQNFIDLHQEMAYHYYEGGANEE